MFKFFRDKKKASDEPASAKFQTLEKISLENVCHRHLILILSICFSINISFSAKIFKS